MGTEASFTIMTPQEWRRRDSGEKRFGDVSVELSGAFKKAQPAGQFEQVMAALLAVLVVLFLGLVAAYLLAAVSYRPIRNLVNRIGGDRNEESEFQAIGSELIA